MKAVLRNLVERYGTYGVDWMGFNLNKRNPLTYHHIVKNSDNGKKSIKNGAPLSKKGHRLLHRIEVVDRELYEEWNDLFREINGSAAPPTNQHLVKIKSLRQRSQIYENNIKGREL